MNNKKLFPVIMLVLVVISGSTHAQSVSTEGAQQFAELGNFKLHSGKMIRNFRIGYRTLGKLNTSRSNAVLWPTWLGGRTVDLLPFARPGNVVDTDKYFVILVDSIGNTVSSSPSNSMTQPNMEFPEFSIGDMVESEYQLATRVLHLPHLHGVVGVSMGGMQTFEWAARYPDFMDVAIPLAGSLQSTSYDKLLWTAEIDAIELDPAWNHGNPTGPLRRGMALSAEIESMNITSPEYRVAHTGPEDFGAFIAGLRKNAKGDAGSVSDAIRQRQAILNLDIPAELGLTMDQVGKQIRTKMLVFVPSGDHLVNPNPALQFAKAIGAPVVILDSSCGHLSFTCISVGPTVAQFLADPTSVRDETLHQ